jgi:hypothetical protein
MTKKSFFLLALLLAFISVEIKSQSVQLSDSAEVSILTNSPWTGAIYGLFGHASIRVKDPARSFDLVFNYGMFSFTKPNFIYHFAKGETDYMVVPIPYRDFIVEYQMKGIRVDEQVIRLSQLDKQKIWDALCINSLPENREYRYNFFFDNCATRLFSVLEKNISGEIILPPSNKNPSFRDLLNEFLEGHDWEQFGINLVIGSSADRPTTEREKMFLPKYLHQVLSRSFVRHADGSQTPLVEKEDMLNPRQEEVNKVATVFSPWTVGFLLLALAALVSFGQLVAKRATRITRLFDSLLFLIAGIAGLVITFLMFFSVHPCMSPNWNYLWLHPLHLIAACLFYLKRCSKYVYYYHFINFAALTVFLLAWSWIPQGLQLSFLPFVATLWMRSTVCTFTSFKK